MRAVRRVDRSLSTALLNFQPRKQNREQDRQVSLISASVLSFDTYFTC